MTVCPFYLQGRCKFGSTCRNEHPAGTGAQQSQFGNQSWSNQPQKPAQNQESAGNYMFTLDSITKDLTTGADKPNWPLSSYGPAKCEPNLYSGLDESSEELRWRAVSALKSGNVAEYQKYETEKIMAADQAYASGRANAKQAYDQACKNSDNANPSQQSAAPVAPSPVSAFGTASNTATFGSSSAFGKPAFGQPAIGQPAFGQTGFGQSPVKPVSAFATAQPATSTTSMFGQTKPVSAFGPASATTTAFGQPAPATSVFGQSSSPAAPSGTSVFGQSSQPQSAFGQPSQPQSAFVKPASGFGAFANAGSSGGGGGFASFASRGTTAFGGAGAPAASAFGQTAPETSVFGGGGGAPLAANTGTATVFGSGNTAPASAFGQTSQPAAPAAGSSAFSAFANKPPQTSVFGQPSQPQSVFGQPSQPASVFGQPTSAFGAAPTTSAFGAPSSSPSAFSASAPTPADKPKVGPPNFEAALSRFRGPQPGRDKYDALLPPNYLEILPAATRQLFESQTFERGSIPDWIPPIQMR